MMAMTSQRGNIKLREKRDRGRSVDCSYCMTDEDDSRKCINHFPEPARIIECRESDHGRDLQQTDLESVR